MKMMLLAQWLFPMAGPMVREAGVVVEDGVIAAVGKEAEMRKLHPDAAVEDLGDSLLLPGFINAHTHLELSDLSPGAPRPDFIKWLRGMIAQANNPGRDVAKATQQGIWECLRFGVTSVADISRHFEITRPILAESPLRAISFGEITAMGQRRIEVEPRLASALTQTQGIRIGLEPHAPYSVEVEGYRRCVEASRRLGVPITTHLAESPDERLFLSSLQGPFRELWDDLPWFDERIPRFEGGPIRLAESVGLLAGPALLAHVNYCDDQEMDLLAPGRASVVYCPRTHAFFGHPPHRWREMLARGINVALGTDSCASSPDLNLLEDVRLLHRLAPKVGAEELLALVTINAAKAIGDGSVGTIAVGKSADLIGFDVSGPDPLKELLGSDLQPSHVWIEGQSIFRT
jgi:cytosine/adenosine deaminase-related metal-dependent hydrolase